MLKTIAVVSVGTALTIVAVAVATHQINLVSFVTFGTSVVHGGTTAAIVTTVAHFCHVEGVSAAITEVIGIAVKEAAFDRIVERAIKIFKKD